MSGIITFGNRAERDRTWFCTGRGFGTLLDRVIERNRRDEPLVVVVRQGKFLSGLHLELIAGESPALADRIMHALATTADEIVSGVFRPTVDGREEEGQLRASVAELLETLRRERSARRGRPR